MANKKGDVMNPPTFNLNENRNKLYAVYYQLVIWGSLGPKGVQALDLGLRRTI